MFDRISRDVPVGEVRPFEPGLEVLTERHPQLLKAFGKFSKRANQMGNLGGGNHFIELASKDMAPRHMIHLPDRDLAYFAEGSEQFADDVEAVHWAQEYAMANRR